VDQSGRIIAVTGCRVRFGGQSSKERGGRRGYSGSVRGSVGANNRGDGMQGCWRGVILNPRRIGAGDAGTQDQFVVWRSADGGALIWEFRIVIITNMY
jgi:hypothetical protein